MKLTLGIDTSNYTTSVALYDPESNVIAHAKKLLPVKEGERGIRQSDAVFHHVNQIDEVMDACFDKAEKAFGISKAELGGAIGAIGVSTRPRRVEGSYMPCFGVGEATAGTMARALGVPLYKFSHQEGHIAAALYSADRLELTGNEFLAFHVSGGTTESLHVSGSSVDNGQSVPVTAEMIGTSSDLKAGQAIDRVGVMLGLKFPCGPELEKLALLSGEEFKIKASGKNFDCSLSGVENKCKKMFEDGRNPEDIALFCIRYVEEALRFMANALTDSYPGKHIVFSGGVMSNSIIRNDFKKEFDCSFAAPEFSADNAAGIAILTHKSREA